MREFRWITFILPLLLAATPIVAAEDFSTAMFLQKACDSPPSQFFLEGFCIGHLQATAWSLAGQRATNIVTEFDPIKKREMSALPPCFPDGVTSGQFRLVVLKFMRDHPELLHKDMLLVAQLALDEAFPCPPR